VITDAKDYGLVLGANGKLYDTKKGQSLPPGVGPMPLLTDEELKAFPEPTTAEVVPYHVARYWDLMALSDHQPARVIGPDAKLRDRPGFDVELLSRNSIPDTTYAIDTHEVLMPMRGHWRLTWVSPTGSATTSLNPGDTCAIPPGLSHSIAPAMTGECSLYRVRATSDKAGATWRG
jgi:hypothetical protein